MSKIIGRCYEGMASARHNISNGLDNSKKDGKALDLEKQVKKLTVEIGRLTVIELDHGAIANAPINERYERIVECRNKIEQLNNSKSHRYTVCPHCGAKVMAGMKYCGNCGKELKKEGE